MKELGVSFRLAFTVWLANVIAVLALRSSLLELYRNSRWVPFMGHHIWAFVPMVVILCLLVAAICFVRSDEATKEKYRIPLRALNIASALLGGVFLVIWFLQMVVDVGAVK